MLEQVLIETTLGALTGYVTNDIALKQLFRDGGFIEHILPRFYLSFIITFFENKIIPLRVLFLLNANCI